MKLLTIFPLVGLLAIWMGFPSAIGGDFQTGKQSPQKPGECPDDPCVCIRPWVYYCKTDNDCPGNKKCCNLCCAMMCVPPE